MQRGKLERACAADGLKLMVQANEDTDRHRNSDVLDCGQRPNGSYCS